MKQNPGLSTKSYGGTEEESYDLDDLQTQLDALTQEILILSAAKADVTKFKRVITFPSFSLHSNLFLFATETEELYSIQDEIAREDKESQEDDGSH